MDATASLPRLHGRSPRRSRRGIRLLLGTLLLVGSGSLTLVAPPPARAHQPVLIDDEVTEVFDPEISKAYYATLSGTAQRYQIDAPRAFDLYVGLLAPDDGSPQKDVRAEIFHGETLLATIGGATAAWTPFYEPFGQNDYFEGGEFRLRAPPGGYTVVVTSPTNTSKYALAIGEIEAFDLQAIIATAQLMPTLEQDFFGVSALDFALSGFGLLSLAALCIIALLVALLYRTLLRRPLLHVLGGSAWSISRRLRGLVALLLFGVALGGRWSPLLLFAAAFLLADALLSQLAARRDTKSTGGARR